MIYINGAAILISAFYATIYFLTTRGLRKYAKYNFICTLFIFIGLCFSLQKIGYLAFNKFQKIDEGNAQSRLEISGDWCLLGSEKRAKIIYLEKNNYQIFNENNMISSGYLVGNKNIVAESWGELVGEYQSMDRIVWKNGTTWMRCK